MSYPTNSLATVSEVVTNTYDVVGRPASLCSSALNGGCYISNAQYTALDQPTTWQNGNSLVENWNYTTPMARLN